MTLITQLFYCINY